MPNSSPRRETSTVRLAMHTMLPSARQVATGLSVGWRVSSWMVWKTCASGRASASADDQPVMRSAAGFSQVTWLRASVGDHRVADRVQGHAQELVLFGQARVQLAHRRHVPVDADHLRRLALGVAQHPTGRVQVMDAAVRPDRAELDVQPGAAGDGVAHGAFHRGQVVGMDMAVPGQ